MNKKHIVMVAMPGSLSIDLTGPSDVFNAANYTSELYHSDNGYKITYASAVHDLEVRMNNNMVIKCQKSIYDIDEPIDTLMIAGFSSDHDWKDNENLYQWINSKVSHIRRISSVCVGAFVLAEAGLLEGRKATTHWSSCHEFKASYPSVDIDVNAIFVKDGKIYTSAGASSGIDLALALVEEDFGRKVSLNVARALVLYLKRSGSQSQFSFLLKEQLSEKEPFRELQKWVIDNLEKDIRAGILADRFAMSERHFTRVFLAETGLTPAKYVEKLRIESAKGLLSETSFTLEKIAECCGFGSKESMSKSFKRTIKISPHQYRQYFGE
ncbi:GlxA family transcriptional regulator [Elizabethkingia ursingii]|uniref:GlxA family transcriptional regulator n=1 Tax=Elizabethkingia ursingii TaxID=1756150 RepID=UPI00201355E5|nr:GlxA family transcriptional regulator [Elizabethkingia ursingii]MCL1669857.1 GlxA family transcriptional regulator [Elizabethkingia ursingii]